MSDVLTDTWYNLAKVTADPQMRRIYLYRANEHDPDLIGSYITERVREHLPTLIEHRNYPLLEEYIEWMIDSQGWKDTLLALRECASSTPIPKSIMVFRRSEGAAGMAGKTRDALFHVLGLAPVLGLDVNLLKELGRFKGESLGVIRDKALKVVLKRMEQQIEKRNTFFIDTQELRGTPFEGYVKEIGDTRRAEVKELSSEPTLAEVFTTYYGFRIFATHSDHTWGDTLSEGRRAFKRLAKDMGKKVTWKGKGRILPLNNLLWTHVSSEMHALLQNLLRVSLGRHEDRAIYELIFRGDSRVLGLLKHMYGRGLVGKHLRGNIQYAIREIGVPCERNMHHDFWIEMARNMSDMNVEETEK